MFSKKSIKYVLPFWISFLMVIFMGSIMTFWNTGTIYLPLFLRDIVVGTAVAYIASLLFPVSKWADSFAGLFKAQQGTLAFLLLSNVIYTVFFATVMTFLFTALAIGFPPYFLRAFLSGLPFGLPVGYIAGCIVSPIALKLTGIMCIKE